MSSPARPSFRHRLRSPETLEQRVVLAANPIITEFMASNRNTLADGRGQSSDWIEIHNQSDALVDLKGWFLTDDQDELNQWPFPDSPHSELAPGERLVVFASGDSTDDEAGHLHTNFRLSADGDYVALVKPDGTTVQSSFSFAGQDYPPQRRDVSFGIGQEFIRDHVVTRESSGHAIVPNAQYAMAYGNRWRGGDEETLIASGGLEGWIEANTNLGFDGRNKIPHLVDTDIADTMRGVNPSAYLRIPFSVSGAYRVTSLQLEMQFDDGFAAFINGNLVAARNIPDPLLWNSRATGIGDPEAIEVFNLPIDVLREGENLLAIQGLNRRSTSSDFLIAPSLTIDYTTGVTSIGYMQQPTPGQPNRSSRIGFVDDLQIDTPRGFYDEPFSVRMTTATIGASIVYTTNGSRPTLTNGLRIDADDDGHAAAVIPIERTTTLRAVALHPDRYASNVVTHTYIFTVDVATQDEMDIEIVQDPRYTEVIHEGLTSIPTLSLVTDDANLFGKHGIYTYGIGKGLEWERPLSVEYLDPNSDQQFQIDAGVRVHGADARNHVKKPLRLMFRSEYGEPTLNFPLFPDSPVTEFDKLIVRGGGHEAFTTPHSVQADSATYIRDQFLRDTEKQMGQSSTHGRFVNLYLNGAYWGIYNVHERPDADFHATYFGRREDDYDVLNTQASVVDGDDKRWRIAIDLANQGLQSAEAYEAIQQYVDVDSLIDNMILRVWAADIDWLRSQQELNSTSDRNKNWYAAADRNGPFRFYVWDGELSMGKNHTSNRNLSLNLTDVDINNSPGRFYAKLKENPEFRLRFSDRLQRHFFNGGAFVPHIAQANWRRLADTIQHAVVAESARWGDAVRGKPLTFDETWKPEIDWVADHFIRTRRDTVLSQFQDIGLYPHISAPQLSRFGGPYGDVLDVTITTDQGDIYYTTDGNDPRDPLTDAPRGTAMRYARPISIASKTLLRVRAWQDGVWSAMTEAEFVQGEEIDATPPTIPQTITAKVLDTQQIELRWSGATDDESGVHSYRVYRDGRQIADVVEPQFLDRFTNIGEYSYQVAAMNHDGVVSDRSLPQQVTVLGVRSVVVTDHTSIEITFSAPVNRTSEDTTNYELDPAVDIVNVTRVSPSVVELETTPLDDTQIYQLAIGAVHAHTGHPLVTGNERLVSPSSGGLILDGLIQDLDAGAGLTIADGRVVGWSNQILDGGDDLVTNSGTIQRVESPSGAPALRFNQTSRMTGNDRGAFDATLNGAGFTWFVVADPATQNSSVKNVLLGTLVEESPWSGFTFGVQSDNRPYLMVRPAHDLFATATEPLDDGFHLFVGRMSSGENTQTAELFVNGPTTVASVEADIHSRINSGALTIGAERETGLEFFDGDLTRILIYDHPLSTAEIQAVGRVLSAQYGLINEFYVERPIPGDSNRDGVFDSRDLDQVFAAGEYEDDLVGNSTFADGDWNGDGEFDSEDLVFAFQAGHYVVRPQPMALAISAVDAVLDSDRKTKQSATDKTRVDMLADETELSDPSPPTR